MEDIIKEICYCPICRSKRFKRVQEGIFFCPKCKKLLEIKEKPPAECHACGRVIFDPTKAVEYGNGKIKCKRCRPKRKRDAGEKNPGV